MLFFSLFRMGRWRLQKAEKIFRESESLCGLVLLLMLPFHFFHLVNSMVQDKKEEEKRKAKANVMGYM